MKKSNGTIGNRTRDLLACSAVPQPTALPRAPITTLDCVLINDSNRAPVARLGPEINSRAFLWALQGPRQKFQAQKYIKFFFFPPFSTTFEKAFCKLKNPLCRSV